MRGRQCRVVVALALCIVLASATASADTSPNGSYHSAQLDADLPVVVVMVNGTPVQAPVPAVALDGSTLVPLRAIGNALSAKVGWDGLTYTATLSSGQVDARSQFCQTFNAEVQGGSQLTLQGWTQYVSLCGSTANGPVPNLPDARVQFCETFASALAAGSQLTLQAWQMYTSLCGSK